MASDSGRTIKAILKRIDWCLQQERMFTFAEFRAATGMSKTRAIFFLGHMVSLGYLGRQDGHSAPGKPRCYYRLCRIQTLEVALEEHCSHRIPSMTCYHCREKAVRVVHHIRPGIAHAAGS